MNGDEKEEDYNSDYYKILMTTFAEPILDASGKALSELGERGCGKEATDRPSSVVETGRSGDFASLDGNKGGVRILEPIRLAGTRDTTTRVRASSGSMAAAGQGVEKASVASLRYEVSYFKR